MKDLIGARGQRNLLALFEWDFEQLSSNQKHEQSLDDGRIRSAELGGPTAGNDAPVVRSWSSASQVEKLRANGYMPELRPGGPEIGLDCVFGLADHSGNAAIANHEIRSRWQAHDRDVIL